VLRKKGKKESRFDAGRKKIPLWRPRRKKKISLIRGEGDVNAPPWEKRRKLKGIMGFTSDVKKN